MNIFFYGNFTSRLWQDADLSELIGKSAIQPSAALFLDYGSGRKLSYRID